MGITAAPVKVNELVMRQWTGVKYEGQVENIILNSKAACKLATTLHEHKEMKSCLAGVVKHHATMDRGDVSSADFNSI
jgi:hypothetical protein